MIVVTGASGRMGRAVQYVVQTDRHDDCLFTTRHLTTSLPAWAEWDPSATSGSLPDLEMSTVLHLAGATPSTGTGYTRSGFMSANCDLTLQTLHMAQEQAVKRVIIASSSSVYGAAKTDVPIPESTPLSAQNDYGQSKAEMERQVTEWCQANPDGPEVSILRIGNIAGADQLLQNAMQSTQDAPLTLDQFPSGRGPLRSYIGPLTLARVLLTLARSPTAMPRHLNVAEAPATYMEDLLSALTAYQTVHWNYRPAGPHAIEAVVMDVDLLGHALGQIVPDADAVRMVYEMHQLEKWNRK